MYYAKVQSKVGQHESLRADGAESYVQRIKFSDWVRSNPSVKFFSALLACFIIGYFVGREHVKYEIRSAMSESLAGLSAIFSGNSKAAPEVSKPKATGKPSRITAQLLDKSFFEGEYGQDQVTMDLAFMNGTGADVRAFDGVLILTDLLGNQISTIKIAINEPVSKGQTLNWSGGVDYNQFDDSDQRLRGAAKENIKVLFDLKNILYADDRLEKL